MYLMLIEDEYLLNKTIRTYLQLHNFKVDSFLDGLKALEAVNETYDLFIIDIDLPNINGIEILEYIRSILPHVPIIMISATININMVTKAYTKGCSDYLKKPFDIKELELKIRAFTRDTEFIIPLTSQLAYNQNTHLLHYNNTEIPLTSQENTLLALLIKNRGYIVTKEQLEIAIWGIDIDSPPLRQLFNRLRKKLPASIIENRIGEGYRIL